MNYFLFIVHIRCLEYTIHDKELKETKEKLDEVKFSPKFRCRF